MNRKGEGGGGGGADDLMGLVIGLVGVVCVWIGLVVGGGGIDLDSGTGWVENPDGVLRWVGEGNGGNGGRVVVLIHGLDEPGGVWDELGPALIEAGYRVALFEYPNDQAVVISAGGLAKAMRKLGEMGIDGVDVVAHSMGGLVSREALTNPEMGASSGMISGVRVGRLILVGTPNEGSAWARLRGVAEIRERVQRWMASDDMDVSILVNLREDGDGQAGVDLLPGSAFLTRLNGRVMPSSVAVTCVVGRIVDPAVTAGAGGIAGGMVGVDEAADALGDGVVSVESASLDGCDDVVVLVANHRSLIRTVEIEEGWRTMVGREAGPEPEGIGVVLDRLGRGGEEEEGNGQ